MYYVELINEKDLKNWAWKKKTHEQVIIYSENYH